MQESKKGQKLYNLFAGLDIGTEKICCAIGGLNYDFDGDKESVPAPKIYMSGFGQRASKGVSQKGITDIEQLEDAILNAVYTAEESAKKNIKEIYVNIPSSLTNTMKIDVSLTLSGQTPVQPMHVRKLFGLSKNFPIAESQHIIHIWPLSYKLDDIDNIKDPIGMIGKELSAECFVVTANKSYVSNITHCISRCNLNVAGFVTDMYANGLSCLIEDEADLGTTIIDIGGKTTQIACFFEGNMVWTYGIPIGGFHITSDLARILSTPLSQAERIKNLYGSLLETNKDSSEHVLITQIANQYGPLVEHVPRKMVLDIIKSRVEDILENIVVAMSKMPNDVDRVVLQKVVFTGGASLLHGFSEIASKQLCTKVRVASQNCIQGVDSILVSPSFSTCAGMLQYAAQDFTNNKNKKDKKPLNFWQKISFWLNEHI